MKKFFLLKLPLFVFFFFLSACSFYRDSESVLIKLPACNSGWRLCKRSGDSNFEVFVESGGKVLLEFDRNIPAAILAYPEGGGRAYGAIYPYSVNLEEKDGFASSVLYMLYNLSDNSPGESELYLARFNWPRFIEACRQRAEDPWNLDRDRVVRAIASGDFALQDIKSVEKNSE